MTRDASNTDVSLRAATPLDAGAIAAVLHAAFVEFEPVYTPAAFAATTPSSDTLRARWAEGPVWVAEVDARIVGTVAAVRHGDALYVRSMAVLPSAHGRGIGHVLLRCAEAHAREEHCARMYLATTPFLSRAIALYERYGFRRSSAGPGELFGTPLLTMELPLAPAPAAEAQKPPPHITGLRGRELLR